MHDELKALEVAHEAARDRFRLAIRTYFPDGLRVKVLDEFYLGQVIGEGRIVGMDLGGGLRVAIGAASVVRVIQWSCLTPIVPDETSRL